MYHDIFYCICIVQKKVHTYVTCIIDSGGLWQNEQLSSIMMSTMDSLSSVTNIEFNIRYRKSPSLADFVQECIAQ